MTLHDVVIIQSDGDWAALYINGKLDRVGDSYLADERIQELYGVRVIGYDEGGRDIMLTGCKREDVPTTLDEAMTKIANRDAERLRAQDRRAEAARLIAEAEGLEKGTA